MTWRQSFVFAREIEFGKGHNASEMLGLWYQPPPGSKFSYTYSREGQNLVQTGQRTWKEFAYGKVSGSWQWSFPLDYDYIEPFLFCFDNYTFVTEESTTGYHTFSRTEEGLTPSFTVRVKTLNKAVGGTGDMFEDLVGCVVTSFKLGSTAGSSQIMVSLGGIFTDMSQGTEGFATGTLRGLDYVHRPNNAVMYSCLYIGDTAVADVVSASVQSKNSVNLIYSVLNPIARSRFEASTSNMFSCAIFSKEPSVLRQRVYTGGYSTDRATRWTKLAPIPAVTLRSTAEDGSELRILAEDVVVRSMGMRDDGQVLYDVLDSTECRALTLTVTNKIPYQYTLCMNSAGKYNTAVQGNYRPILIETAPGDITSRAIGHFTSSESYLTE